ncbi:MAG: N-acetyltransferase [Bacillota bacterium]|nr:N-acetyltransferase [Bacillota bacterium]
MNKNDYTIRLEQKEDYKEVENLTREAFWNVYRPGCMEHFVLHCFRGDKDFVPELDFVMEKYGQIIGHVMYAHSAIKADDTIPIMTFGPISIAPEFKRQGYGKALLDYSMERAKELGAGALAITGNILFYGKSGFVIAKTKGIRYEDDPDADYFLIKELKEGFLDGISGTYKDPEGYFVCDKFPAEFEKYEAQFPYKEKLELPGQLV